MILPGDIIYYLGPSRDKFHSIYLHIIVIFSPSKIKDVVWEIMKSWYSFALSNSFWNCFETPRSKIPRLQACPSLIAPIKHPMIQCSIPVLCPSILRLAKDKVMGVLDQASKARKISLELQNVEFASELSGQMKNMPRTWKPPMSHFPSWPKGTALRRNPWKRFWPRLQPRINGLRKQRPGNVWLRFSLLNGGQKQSLGIKGYEQIQQVWCVTMRFL